MSEDDVIARVVTPQAIDNKAAELAKQNNPDKHGFFGGVTKTAITPALTAQYRDQATQALSDQVRQNYQAYLPRLKVQVQQLGSQLSNAREELSGLTKRNIYPRVNAPQTSDFADPDQSDTPAPAPPPAIPGATPPPVPAPSFAANQAAALSRFGPKPPPAAAPPPANAAQFNDPNVSSVMSAANKYQADGPAYSGPLSELDNVTGPAAELKAKIATADANIARISGIVKSGDADPTRAAQYVQAQSAQKQAWTQQLSALQAQLQTPAAGAGLPTTGAALSAPPSNNANGSTPAPGLATPPQWWDAGDQSG
jgi:hypothetical protein